MRGLGQNYLGSHNKTPLFSEEHHIRELIVIILNLILEVLHPTWTAGFCLLDYIFVCARFANKIFTPISANFASAFALE